MRIVDLEALNARWSNFGFVHVFLSLSQETMYNFNVLWSILFCINKWLVWIVLLFILSLKQSFSFYSLGFFFYDDFCVLIWKHILRFYIIYISLPFLSERTYTAPTKWMRGKGRVTMQFGCCYNYATVSVFLLVLVYY